MRKLFVVSMLLLIPVVAMGVTVEGKTYKPTATIDGKSLKLIGAGLREKWWVDVYTMGAYTESGSCKPADIISKDEVKYIRLDMLRDVDAEKMADAIDESFANNMPKNASAELKKQRKAFMSYFKKECKEGMNLEFTYVPGKGTTCKQNGASMGPPLTGVAFQKVFWSLYFSKKTCCEDLKKQILKTCK